MRCNDAFEDYICKCVPYNDEIIINTALTPGLELAWFIADKFENEYSGSVTITDDGKIHIPVAELPEGLLNQYAGLFSISFEEVGACKKLSIPLARNYDEILLQVKGGASEKNTVGCVVPCAGAGASTLVNFDVYDSEITINWSLAYSSVYGNWPTISVYQLTATPGVYELVSVQVQQIRTGDTLDQIIVDNGGSAEGYIIIS